jgi:rSAM/selenodomain-associated transferase 1
MPGGFFLFPRAARELIFFPVYPSELGKGEILVFARYPEAGRCKTRLAAGLGEAGALAVYRALLGHTLDVVRGCPARKVLWVDPPERARNAADWAPGMDLYLPQSQGDLGDRLAAATRARFESGARKVLLIGCDCPQISKDSLISSLAALDDVDVVLGPTDDGGYYLLGLKGWHPFLFQNIPWSTAEVLEKTLNILKNHSLSYFLRDSYLDVDTLDDYHRVRHLEPLKGLGIG